MPVWEEDTITAHHRLEVTGGEAAVQVLVVVVAMEAMLGISQLVFWWGIFVVIVGKIVVSPLIAKQECLFQL
jgi:hypothetical protein